MINSLSETDDLTKNINSFNKTDNLIKSEKIKVFPMVCSKYVSSWTGLGGSGHDGSQSFGPILHVFTCL